MDASTRTHRRDIACLLKKPLASIVYPECYTTEYQEAFSVGVRICRKHAYPFKYHATVHATCPKCVEDLEQWAARITIVKGGE